MSTVPHLDDLLSLPPDRRLPIMEALWVSLASAPENVPIPDWHRDIVEQRLAEDEGDESPGESWPEVRRRVEQR
jgi:putative addiction module component (TIGR02574 family)